MKGKDKCELLKDMRKQIAEACHIEYTPKTCNLKEDCLGYCPICDTEAKWLLEEIRRKGYLDKDIWVNHNYRLTEKALEDHHPEGRKKMNQIFEGLHIIPELMLGVVEFIDYDNIEDEEEEDFYDDIEKEK